MQTELFEMSGPATISEDPGVAKTSVLEKKLMPLRLDQTIGIVLVLMVFFVLSFSWGVEKGKRSVQNTQVIRATPVPEAPVLPKDLTVVADIPTIAEKIANTPAATVPAQTVAPETKTEPFLTDKPDGKYTIQHVIYLTNSAAEREIKKLAKKGQQAFIIPSGKYIQVCVSGFQTKKEATQHLKQLRTQGIIANDAYVRNIPA